MEICNKQGAKLWTGLMSNNMLYLNMCTWTGIHTAVLGQFVENEMWLKNWKVLNTHLATVAKEPYWLEPCRSVVRL